MKLLYTRIWKQDGLRYESQASETIPAEEVSYIFPGDKDGELKVWLINGLVHRALAQIVFVNEK